MPSWTLYDFCHPNTWQSPRVLLDGVPNVDDALVNNASGILRRWPADLNGALLIGPLLIALGIATFTAHMFIFYFAIASAITPPLALATFVTTTITKAEPMATGFRPL